MRTIVALNQNRCSNRRRTRRNARITQVCLRFPVVILVAAVAGCASLASSTGPRSQGSEWSVADLQLAHVGEEVRFDFVLLDWLGKGMSPLGVADYAVVTIGPSTLVTEADVYGHFQFSHRLDDVRPGDRISVEASAFKQRGSRDIIVVAGEVVTADSAYDEPDRRVAGDRLTLEVYQAEVELPLQQGGQPFDPDSGVLRLKTTAGKTTPVFHSTKLRRGYDLVGPDAGGAYSLRYRPLASELSDYGNTDIYFRIFDIAGVPHEAGLTLECP